MEETAAWLEEHKLNFCHVFTVDDLHHLHRGGRVSKMTAVLGTMINIKPLLHVDDEGHLIPLDKVRGRKKSLASLVDMMDARLGSYRGKNDAVFISHGDCPEDCAYVMDKLRALGVIHLQEGSIGPVIGTHSGPGTVALFWVGGPR